MLCVGRFYNIIVINLFYDFKPILNRAVIELFLELISNNYLFADVTILLIDFKLVSNHSD